MIDSILAILTGGATGLLGTVVSAGVGYFERRQRHAHELELRSIDLEITRAESSAAERTAALEVEGRESEAESRALAASYRAAATRWSRGDSGWLVAVDVVRGLIRPVLTVGSLALVAAVYWHLPLQPVGDVGARIVDTLLYVSTSTVLWWFGTRPSRSGAGVK